MSIINYTPYNNIPSEEDDDDSFWLDGIPCNPDFIATSSAENPANPPIDYQSQARKACSTAGLLREIVASTYPKSKLRPYFINF